MEDDQTEPNNPGSQTYKTSDNLPWAIHISEKFEHPK